MSIESVLQSKSLIKGFLCPVFYDEGGGGSALNHEDFCKVRDGYACAKCLAEFVMYLPQCPVCKHERDIAADLQAPDPLHEDHLAERVRTEGMDVGAVNGFDEFMQDVNANPDIEHIPLSKMKKRKRH